MITTGTNDSHLLARRFPERLCPSDLPGVTLHLEVFVTSDKVKVELSDDPRR